MLETVGRQAASYLAEEEAADALVEARQLEAFNSRLAIVVHDIKNLAGQLSLMLNNAERNGDNTAFKKAFPTLKQIREQAEFDAVTQALALAEDNVSQAARLLGVSRPTLYNLMRHFKLKT